MICILLVAGHGTLLETQIKYTYLSLHCQNDGTGLYSHLAGVPKALLPGVGGKKILDFWWETVNMRQLFSEVYLVTNADKYKHYERWATANDFPVGNLVNDGSTTLEGRLGAVADLELAIRSRRLSDDIMVIAGDMLCADQNFDIAQVLRFFRSKGGELAIYYEMEEGEETTSRGIVEVCPVTHRITRFLEKPNAGLTGSRLASVVFYCLRRQTLPCLAQFLDLHPCAEDRMLGRLWEWLVNEEKLPVFGMKLPTGFQLIGQVGLADYTKWLAHYSAKQQESPGKPITSRSYARIGLMGNPSDGFNGKTIAMTIANFWAEVTLTESQTLVLVPHPLNDPTEFGSLQDLYCISRKEGYLGGLRLLQATCKKFYHFCSKQGIALSKQNFTLKYDTNIPRQVVSVHAECRQLGLRVPLALLQHAMEGCYNTRESVHIVLTYNRSLQLTVKAGMVQTGIPWGCSCQSVDISLLPLLNFAPPRFLFFGKIRSERGCRSHTDACVCSTSSCRRAQSWLGAIVSPLLSRRSVYTDECLGQGNLKMVELARQFGSAAKLPGSGGAVVGLCLDPHKLGELKRAFQEAGCVFCQVVPYDPSSSTVQDQG
nr:PREDICTED: uncharacterized protein LOC102683076 [Lepisosteus oculatus]